MSSKSDAELEGWRDALSEALGLHGRLVVELVPELELIIGEQPPASDLPARQSHLLFQTALRRFVGAFAEADHPLVLFLDDLHWADAATLDLLEELMIQSDLRHLLVVGSMLSTVLGTSQEHVHTALWEAARHDLVERLDGSYRFVHDRVQEATYSSIHAGQRAQAHLRIGRLIAAQTPPQKRDESIFEIVNQLNRCLGLTTSVDERQQLAEFNLAAGRRANASTAYASALSYFATGRDPLTEECWQSRRELIFALELHRAECELLTGALSDAENHFASLCARATGTTERADVARLGIDLYSMRTSLLVVNRTQRSSASGAARWRRCHSSADSECIQGQTSAPFTIFNPCCPPPSRCACMQ